MWKIINYRFWENLCRAKSKASGLCYVWHWNNYKVNFTLKCIRICFAQNKSNITYTQFQNYEPNFRSSGQHWGSVHGLYLFLFPFSSSNATKRVGIVESFCTQAHFAFVFLLIFLRFRNHANKAADVMNRRYYNNFEMCVTKKFSGAMFLDNSFSWSFFPWWLQDVLEEISS